jgi:hypothetical protein
MTFISDMLEQSMSSVLDSKTDGFPSARPLRPLPRGRHVTPDQAAEVARYVAQITAELGLMTRSARLDGLSYFLEMARIEAQTLAATASRG